MRSNFSLLRAPMCRILAAAVITAGVGVRSVSAQFPGLQSDAQERVTSQSDPLAEDTGSEDTAAAGGIQTEGLTAERMLAKATFGPPAGFKQLDRDGSIWIDPVRQLVLCDGYVALREGQLEMFACLMGTKEHESIVAIFGKASWVHTALLAIGAEPGRPVSFDPFQPPTGAAIDVLVLWYDEAGRQHAAAATDWMVRIDTQKTPEDLQWVFAGSQDIDDGEGGRMYLGDSGDFITVANFPTATLDVTLRSDSANSSLMFEPKTAVIPPKGTPVRLVLKPAS